MSALPTMPSSRFLWMGGLSLSRLLVPVALGALGCEPPRSGAARGVVTTTVPEVNSEQPASITPSVFAGRRGACAIRAPGEAHCWGEVPSRITPLARQWRSVGLSYEMPESPVCWQNGRGVARCAVSCREDDGCPVLEQAMPTEQMVRLGERVLLVNRDDSVCYLGLIDQVCGSVFPPAYHDSELDPNQPLSLAGLVDSEADKLLFQDGRICLMSSYEQRISLECRNTTWREEHGGFRAMADYHFLDVEGDVLSRDGAPVGGFHEIEDLVASQDWLCGHRARGAVFCNHQRLDDSGDTTWGGVERLEGTECVEQLTAGTDFVCSSGCRGVQCWGENLHGELGKPGPAKRGTRRPAISNVAQVRTGRDFSCALGRQGSVHCWGKNDNRQLGSDPKTLYARPLRVPLPAPARELALGDSTSCAVLEGGQLHCWGNNVEGIVNPTHPSEGEPPRQVIAAGVQSVALKYGTACATLSGEVVCWGDNEEGQLGRGHTQPASDIARVPGLSDIVKVRVNSGNACAITRGGQLYCWGSFTVSRVDVRPTPTLFQHISEVVDVVSVTHRICALTRSGQVACFESPEVSVPSKISEPVVGLAPGLVGFLSQICWLRSGDGRCLNRSDDAPLDDIAFVDGVAQISFGNDHSCAVLKDGGVRCHGGNEFGQLGGGELLSSRVPLAVELE